jgi:membrane protease YdiL (CAAX protease family)
LTEPSDSQDAEKQESIAAPAPRPGASIFTIEGRAAPGLFVVGWLATIIGLGVTIVGQQAAPSRSSPVLITVGIAILAVGLVAGAGAQAVERKARGRDPYTGPSPALLLAASIPVALLGTILVGVVLNLVHLGLAQPVNDLVLVVLQDGVYIALVALLVVGSGALTWTQIGVYVNRRRAIEDLLWGAAFAIPVIVVTLFLTAALVTLFHVVPESPLPPTGQGSGLVLHLVAGAAIAPIGEEILFRGVTTTAWVRSFGVRAGIVRGAVFFALAHVLLISAPSVGVGIALAIVGFVGRLPIALVLGWVFVRRGSLYASIGLHAAFNAVLLLLAELSFHAR